MKEMVIYNITALLIIGVSILCFTKIRTGLTNKNLRRVLEVFLLILAVGTILTIAFLDLIALGVIGPVPTKNLNLQGSMELHENQNYLNGNHIGGDHHETENDPGIIGCSDSSGWHIHLVYASGRLDGLRSQGSPGDCCF